MSAEATRWLIERGVRMMGCDAITFDPPVWAMFERKLFWEAHRVMWDEEYWHLENLMNLEQIGRRTASSCTCCRSSGSGPPLRRCARWRPWRKRSRDGRPAPREATAPAKASGARAVLAFGDPDCAQVARAGGKGASLARLSALGLPVPPGFVVPADRLVASLPDGGAALRALPAAQAQAAVARADLPPEIGAAYEALGDAVPVAVRSSACAEDSEDGFYAGQQETFLHVRGARRRARPRARLLGLLLLQARAVLPRTSGLARRPGDGVVVQRMVQADVAGVLFTCHPVQRRRDRMVVEAVLGLGEAAVSGQVTPDHYVIKRDGTVKRARVATQPFAIVAAPDGGTRQHRLAPAEGSAPKLGDRRLEPPASATTSERRLGCPQDIEWAIEEGNAVLQARPVTTR